MAFAIGGGAGFIGRHLTKSLLSEGRKIYVITRTPKNKDQLSWDFIEKSGLPPDVRHVINLAGRNILEMSPLFIFKRQNQAYMRDVFRSRIDTTKLLSAAIQKSPKNVKSFIVSSAIGIYHGQRDAEFTENDDGDYEGNWITRLCNDWEKAAKLHPSLDHIRQIQLRTGIVLENDGGMLSSMYIPFKCGLGANMADGQHWISWIHMRDMVGLIWHAFSCARSNGPINCVAPLPVRDIVFCKSLAATFNRPCFLSVPEVTLQLMFGKRKDIILLSPKVLPARAVSEGYQFKFPSLEAALRDIYC